MLQITRLYKKIIKTDILHVFKETEKNNGNLKNAYIFQKQCEMSKSGKKKTFSSEFTKEKLFSVNILYIAYFFEKNY